MSKYRFRVWWAGEKAVADFVGRADGIARLYAIQMPDSYERDLARIRETARSRKRAELDHGSDSSA